MSRYLPFYQFVVFNRWHASSTANKRKEKRKKRDF